MTKHCAIEGSSYMGKTTIIHGLYGRGYPVVAEYDRFIDLNGGAAEKIDIADALIDIERVRTSLVSGVSSDVVFSDRSVLSLLTYYDMALMCEMGDREENLRVREHILNRIDKEISLGNIALMDTIIVVRLDQNEFSKRVDVRGVTPIWQLANYAVAQHITKQAAQYGRQLLGAESVAEIDLSSLSKVETVEKVLDTSRKLPKTKALQRRFNELT